MLTLAEVLSEAYAKTWTSRDVRAGDCSLDLCRDAIRQKPDGTLVRRKPATPEQTSVQYYGPEIVLSCIFDSPDAWWAGISRDVCPREGKVDAELAKRQWAEWQVKNNKKGRSYAHVFLREHGLPIKGGERIKGELSSELAQASGI